jgi:hypothetical protein
MLLSKDILRALSIRYAHHNPESLRHGVDVLDEDGYVLVTAEKTKAQSNP